MWRVDALPFLDGLRGVTGAVLDADVEADLLYWCAQVAFDVGSQRFEWGDVEGVKALMWHGGQISQCWQETGEGFAAACGSNQEGAGIIRTGEHVALMRVRLPIAFGKPCFDILR